MRELAAEATTDADTLYQSILPQIEQAAKEGKFSIDIRVLSYRTLEVVLRLNGFSVDFLHSFDNDVEIRIYW
jgi:hypothetical protein